MECNRKEKRRKVFYKGNNYKLTQINKIFIIIKASFLEIYNEQINDLLNPKANNLQIRWTSKQGFFVENLLVIDCQRPQDIAEIIIEGTKNRKIGSHDLNKDSSRSHSILTIYVISEVSFYLYSLKMKVTSSKSLVRYLLWT